MSTPSRRVRSVAPKAAPSSPAPAKADAKSQAELAAIPHSRTKSRMLLFGLIVAVFALALYTHEQSSTR